MYDAQIRMLQKRRPTKSRSVLNRREIEMKKIEDAKLLSTFPYLTAVLGAQSAITAWIFAYAEAKDVECARLQRLSRHVKKS